MQGSCLCGALRYEVDTPLGSMLNCHCSRCRKHHGAPFVTFATAPASALRWHQGEDAVVKGDTGSGGPRHFCGQCGSPAPRVIEGMGIALIPVGTLDGDPGLRPQGHLFAASKASWHDITDPLPQYERYPPSFGELPSLPDPVAAPAAPDHVGGSCLCGSIAFELRNPVAIFQCHCGRCRKARGAAHGANLFCRIADLHWLRGEDQVVGYKLPEARFYGVSFCRQCGSSMPRLSAERGVYVVPVSALDADPGMRPTAHIFTGSKAPWFEITDAYPQHAEGPPSLSWPPR